MFLTSNIVTYTTDTNGPCKIITHNNLCDRYKTCVESTADFSENA